MNTLDNNAINVFLDDGIRISDEKIKFLASKYKLHFYQVESVVIDCAQNIDDCLGKSLYAEYNGDYKELANWFESYVDDSVNEYLECGLIEQKEH